MKEVSVVQLADFSILVTYQRGDGTFFTSQNNFHEKYRLPGPPVPSPLERIQAQVDAAQARLDECMSKPVPDASEVKVFKVPVGDGTKFIDKSFNSLDLYKAALDDAHKKVAKFTDLLKRVEELDKTG